MTGDRSYFLLVGVFIGASCVAALTGYAVAALGLLLVGCVLGLAEIDRH